MMACSPGLKPMIVSISRKARCPKRPEYLDRLVSQLKPDQEYQLIQPGKI
jgi:hypothetical protein